MLSSEVWLFTLGSAQGAGMDVDKISLARYPGVTIRKRKNKDVIVISFEFDGKRHRAALDLPVSMKNIRYASDLLGAIKTEIKIRKFDPEDHFTSKRLLRQFDCVRVYTVDHIVALYHKTKANQKKTVDTDLRLYEMYIKDQIGGWDCRKVRQLDLMDIISNMEHFSKSHKMNVFTALAGAYKIAVQNDIVAKSPCDHLDYGKSNPAQAKPLRAQDVKRIFTLEDTYWKNVFIVSVFTGLSNNEQFGLTWSDIDFERGVINVKKAWDFRERKITKVKTAYRPRSIEMIRLVYDALIYLKENSNIPGLVFFNVDKNRDWAYDTYRTKWKSALELSDIEYRSPYKSRHTFASVALNIGLPVAWVKERMGHADSAMIDSVYGKWMEMSSEELRYFRELFLQKLPNGIVHHLIEDYLSTKIL